MENQLAILVAGLGYGDEGKGSTVDFLVRQHGASLVVRYNGGAQAAHRVVTPEGFDHVFAQFGSGTFVAGVETHLSRFIAVNPLSMLSEEVHLRTLGITDAFSRTTIDSRAVVITPFHRVINQLRELARGEQRNGSCGMGVGETLLDASEYPDEVLRVSDLLDKNALESKLRLWQQRKRAIADTLFHELPQDAIVDELFAELYEDEAVAWCLERYEEFVKVARIVGSEYLTNALRNERVVVFEGAQGVLLDSAYGFWPYVTKGNATFTNAETLLAESAYTGAVHKVGVLRGYGTRHGAGPFVTEDSELTRLLPDAANGANAWQGGFRVGHFDLLAARYALQVCGGVDSIALTNLDRLSAFPRLQVCTAYREVNGEVLKSIPFREFPRRDSQQELTDRVKGALPLYENIEGGIEEYVQFLEIELNIPVTLLSFGPTSQDKQTRISYTKQTCLV